ncbi:hypothetical protein [Streptomyces cavernicola]|uniref:DUF1707 domain-containing protein n=1 Tax=Streptomyces cavernicola TaxID=3043613 RepID=A0ABT6SKC7_9ACTN|nr:hypothetical protein [Streptomyces sp. B-S-A6]MDI3408364.1 hypothetical protein [Streptomyces sp. B-S-A6]
MSAKGSIELRHAELQRQIRDLHTQVAVSGPDDDEYDEKYARLVEVTGELLDFEQEMPALLAEPARASSERVVLWSWRGQAVVAAVLVALVFVLDRTWWWTLLLVPHFVGTVVGSLQKVRTEGHRALRHTAMGLHVLAVLVALLFFGLLSMWFLIAIIIGWLLVGSSLIEDPKNAVPGGQR